MMVIHEVCKTINHVVAYVLFFFRNAIKILGKELEWRSVILEPKWPLISRYTISIGTAIKWLLSVSFILFLLWDIYHKSFGKIFDLIGLFILLITTVLLIVKLYLNVWDRLFIVFLFPFVLIGFYWGGVSASIAVSLGMLTFIIYRGSDLTDSFKYNLLLSSFFIIFFFQILQYIYFKISGNNLVFYPVDIFNPPRNYSGTLFRASGFMAEANAISTTVILIFSGLVSYKKPNIFLTCLICFSLLISKSVYGIIMIPFVFFISGSLKLSHSITLFFISLPVIIRLIDLSIMFERLSHFFDDPSFVARFGINNLSNHIYDILIPSGFNTNPEDTIAANGLISCLDAFGLFIIPFMIVLYKIVHRKTFLFILFLMVSYQMFTTQIFWAVIGINKAYRSLGKYNVCNA